MKYEVHLTREADGNWVATVPAIPGLEVRGSDRDGVVARVKRRIAEIQESDEEIDYLMADWLMHDPGLF